jgi:hypothetical protein
MEYALAVRGPGVVQQLLVTAVRAENLTSMIGFITLDEKSTGKRSAGNSHAPFDEGGGWKGDDGSRKEGDCESNGLPTGD